MTARIQLRTGTATTNGKRCQLVVGEVDITDAVLADGLEIGRTGNGPYDLWFIQVRLVGDIDIDLPDAIVEAVQA